MHVNLNLSLSELVQGGGMKLIGLFNLFGSCAISFFAAIMVFKAGYGVMAAFFVYAFGGAFLMVFATSMLFVPGLVSRRRATSPAVHARLVGLRV